MYLSIQVDDFGFIEFPCGRPCRRPLKRRWMVASSAATGSIDRQTVEPFPSVTTLEARRIWWRPPFHFSLSLSLSLSLFLFHSQPKIYIEYERRRKRRRNGQKKEKEEEIYIYIKRERKREWNIWSGGLGGSRLDRGGGSWSTAIWCLRAFYLVQTWNIPPRRTLVCVCADRPAPGGTCPNHRPHCAFSFLFSILFINFLFFSSSSSSSSSSWEKPETFFTFLFVDLVSVNAGDWSHPQPIQIDNWLHNRIIIWID